MDPLLRERLREAGDDDELSLLLRFGHGPTPPSMRIVTRFGDVVTARIAARDVAEVYRHPTVESMKAPRPVALDRGVSTRSGRTNRRESAGRVSVRPSDARRPRGLAETGRGVVVGVIDYGCDVTHPDFRNADGSSRIEALWDQGGGGGSAPEPWGYGTVHERRSIDTALATDKPFDALGYKLARQRKGAHGTHVLGVAAGNGRGGGPSGMAPEASLVFVHLSQHERQPLHTLGDSLRLMEALDFIYRTAGDRPCAVNLSIGSHGGPHDGTTLLERAFDAAVSARPGRALCQSAGNYRASAHHAHTRLRQGHRWNLAWHVVADRRSGTEMEIWYPGSDRLGVTVTAPDGRSVTQAELGAEAELRVGDRKVGRLYHRELDPNNGDHHVDLFLDAGAPAGRWRIRLDGERIEDGRVSAWIERKTAATQSKIGESEVDTTSTLGTIATGRNSLVVGAFDGHDPTGPPAWFSSVGPTRDGRTKPDLVAPGVEVLSASSNWHRQPSAYERKSGTSMAAPLVTGLVACMFEAAPNLSMNDIRRLTMNNAVPTAGPAVRTGRGRVHTARTVHAARRMRDAQRRQVGGQPEQLEAQLGAVPPMTQTGPQSHVVDPRLLGVDPPVLRFDPAMRGLPMHEDVSLHEGIPVSPIPAGGLAAWQDLIRFRPPARANAILSSQLAYSSLHDIRQAYGPVNLDFYPVEIGRLPRGHTASSLLHHIRKDINSFVDTGNTRFSPYSRAARALWASSAPLGAAVHLDFYGNVYLNVDDGTVVTSQAGSADWVFSTIWTFGDGNHPVSGNRQFAISRSDDGRLWFYTKAADRLTTVLGYGAEAVAGVAFAGADRLWKSLQQKVNSFINANGGSSAVRAPISKRYDWPAVWSRYGGSSSGVVRPSVP